MEAVQVYELTEDVVSLGGRGVGWSAATDWLVACSLNFEVLGVLDSLLADLF